MSSEHPATPAAVIMVEKDTAEVKARIAQQRRGSQLKNVGDGVAPERKEIRVFCWFEDNLHRPLFTLGAQKKRGAPCARRHRGNGAAGAWLQQCVHAGFVQCASDPWATCVILT